MPIILVRHAKPPYFGLTVSYNSSSSLPERAPAEQRDLQQLAFGPFYFHMASI
jgi:hypothetical protein